MDKQLLPKIQAFVGGFDVDEISDERKAVLDRLVSYVQGVVNNGKTVHLNFICTHNSRRSQFSQLWGQVAAYVHGIDMQSYSGGVEVTAFNERAVASIERAGFVVTAQSSENPHYMVKYAEGAPALEMFSKLFDDPSSAANEFAAVMTCSHADENCPFIPGADARIPVRYEDPKAFDDTDQEAEMYDTRSKQIGTELMYVFSQIRVPV